MYLLRWHCGSLLESVCFPINVVRDIAVFRLMLNCLRKLLNVLKNGFKETEPPTTALSFALFCLAKKTFPFMKREDKIAIFKDYILFFVF